MTLSRLARTLPALLAALLLAGLVALVPQPAGAAAGDVTVFGASTPNIAPRGDMDLGPDGNVWFANAGGGGGRLGEVTTSGAITLHAVTGTSGVTDIAIGGDGNVWFSYSNGTTGGYGRWNTTTDVQTLFPLGSGISTSTLVAAGDGNLWLLSNGAARRILTATGALDASTVSVGTIGDMIIGPDGNLWISQDNTARTFLKLNPTTGVLLNTYTLPANVHPGLMDVGPDGNIWAEYEGPFPTYGIFRFELGDSSFDYFPFPGGDRGALTPVAGPDGNIWFVTRYDDAINRMSTSGTFLNTYTPSAFDTNDGAPWNMVVGADDRLWTGTPTRVVRVDPGEAVDPECLPPAFTDVSTSHPFFADICWMDQEGISTGYQPGPTYKPSAAVSRSAMSAFMYRLAGSPAFSDPAEPTFGDVATNNAFYTEIEWMASEDITTGTPASPKPLYKPGSPVSRGAMSAFMYRLAGSPELPDPPASTFGDVNSAHPFFTEIEWMASEEITTGTPASPKPLYKPAANVSRAAMSAFMHRLAPLLPS